LPGAWLLDGTYLERPLGRPIQYRDTSIPSVTPMPATRKQLETWFRDAASGGVQPGDTLLFFVTDHGQRGKTPEDTSIVLWQRESLAVKQLAPLIAQLPRGARVVTVMSQCYAGAFAELALAPQGNRAVGDTCGFFSTTPERVSHGCSPGGGGSPPEGHAISFIDGLRQSNRLATAHASTLVSDRTPDVPNRTSDVLLGRVVSRVAAARGVTPDQLVSSLAATVMAGDHEDAALARQVAASFAVPIPASQDELAAVERRLRDLQERLRGSESMWRAAAGELAQVNLDDFLDIEPEWAVLAGPRQLQFIDPARLEELQTKFIGLLAEVTGRNAGRKNLMVRGRVRSKSLEAAGARSAARAGALLRLRTLLISLVGRHLLASGAGTAQERADHAALLACENAALPGGGVVGSPVAETTPFPSMDEDEKVAATLEAGSLGVALGESAKPLRDRYGLPAGAMVIRAVDPGSAASAAGLRRGDIVIGGAGAPVNERGGLKMYLASLRPGQSHAVEILRDGRRILVQAQLPAGGKPPEAADLGAAGRAALRSLQTVRGDVTATLGGGQPQLLFFWATWCGVCKRAVPELMALENRTAIRVVAITDEQPEIVEGFLDDYPPGFFRRVAIDTARRASEAFEVEGLPTLVLVDEQGRVRWRGIGYTKGMVSEIDAAAKRERP
jgi:thiol-disulfide isomerase/thioredoxin